MVNLMSFNGRKKNNRLPNLKNAVTKLQQSLALSGRLSLSTGSSSRSSWKTDDRGCEEVDDDGCEDLPKYVKEGHFTVISSEGGEPKRFVIPITCLTNPKFLRLLEEAAEEYGFFNHVDALTIPCRPSDLEKISKGIFESFR